MNLLLATRNEHKRREFARLLGAGRFGDLSAANVSRSGRFGDVSAANVSRSGRFGIDILPDAVELPPELGDTFAANALGKARAAAAATGRLAIADDSGIEAAALGGAPGVRSARYAGEHASDQQNLAKLLREAPTGSRLRYVCVIALVDPGRDVEALFEGTCEGTLAARPRGDRGFGYDPAFIPDDGPPGLTMAELTDEQKDAISHRGRAARRLASWLEGERPGANP